MSPVRVLAKMLHLLGPTHLSDRLWAALRAVKACCETASTTEADGRIEHEEDWRALLQALPLLRKRPRLEKAEGETASGLQDVMLFKRLRARLLRQSGKASE